MSDEDPRARWRVCWKCQRRHWGRWKGCPECLARVRARWRRRKDGDQADHGALEQGGASTMVRVPIKEARRRVMLRVVDDPVNWEPRAGVPAGGRAECRNGERPCPYVRCKHHLWLVLAEDREGAPGPGRETTLEPRWLEYPTPACCELDVAEAAARTGEVTPFEYIGEVMARHHTAVRIVEARGRAKLRELGMMIEDLRR